MVVELTSSIRPYEAVSFCEKTEPVFTEGLLG
jgi:hypothetical protein